MLMEEFVFAHYNVYIFIYTYENIIGFKIKIEWIYICTTIWVLQPYFKGDIISTRNFNENIVTKPRQAMNHGQLMKQIIQILQ